MHTSWPRPDPSLPPQPVMPLVSLCSGRMWCRLWPLRLLYVLLSVGLLRHYNCVLWSGLPGSMGAVRLIAHAYPTPNANTNPTPNANTHSSPHAHTRSPPYANTHAQAQLVQHRRVPAIRPDLIQHHVE